MRFLKLIEEDKETIKRKDQKIYELENILKDRLKENENIRNELSKAEYKKDYDSFLQNEVNKMTTEHLTDVDNLQTEIDKFKKKIFSKDDQINTFKEERECLISRCEMFKTKVSVLEHIIEEKDKELSSRNTISKNKMQLLIDKLKEENANLKILMWQKDSDIEKMKEIIKKKDNIIKETQVETGQYLDKIHQLKVQNGVDKRQFENTLIDKEKEISYMKEIIKETEIKVRNNIYDKDEGNSKANKDDNNISRVTEESNNCCPVPNFVKKDLVSSNCFPKRPPRRKPGSRSTNIKNDSNLLIEDDKGQENSDADGLTFHDAFNDDVSHASSDEEDVSIEYFELDEELDDRQHRKSDINLDESENLKNIKLFGSQILNKVFSLKKN